MTDFNATDRSRLAEDEYFRRQDAELMRRLRERGQAARERAALADALGVPDPHLCDQLHAAGLRANTAVLVEWLPAVEVAWLDGADEAERHALRVQFNADERTSPEGMVLLDSWMMQPPPDALFAAARLAIRARMFSVDADQRAALLGRVLARCDAAGRSAGGYFGIGALSSDERGHIAVIQTDLERPL